MGGQLNPWVRRRGWRESGAAIASIASTVSMLAWCVPVPSAAVDEPRSGLSFAERFHDAGAVDQGDAITADYSFENRGTVQLTISDPIVACDCAAEILGARDVPPGGRGVVRFRCDTAGMSGDQKRTVTIHVSDVDRRSILLTMRASVTLDIVVQPHRLYLGNVLRGARRSRALKVRSGNAGHIVRGVTTDGSHLEAGAEKGGSSVYVAVPDDAPIGAFSEDVLIETSSARFPVLRVPVTGVVVAAEAPSRW